MTFAPYILVVDDESDARDILSIVLRNVGLEVQTASSGLEAINLIKQNIPSLIFLDLRMPDMNGFELLYWLRSNPETAGIAVAVISAYIGNMQLPQLQGIPVVPKAQMRAQVIRDAVVRMIETGQLPDHIRQGEQTESSDTEVIREAILSSLTARELEVLKLIAVRYSNDEIAAHLHIAIPTVKTHVSAIFDKLNVRNRREAAAQAYFLRLL